MTSSGRCELVNPICKCVCTEIKLIKFVCEIQIEYYKYFNCLSALVTLFTMKFTKYSNSFHCLESKARKKSIKQALRRSHSRDTDSELNDVAANSKSKSKNKKLRSQSSESADEKEVRGRRQRKLGRTKSRDTDGSNNSLETITESPKTDAKKKANAENKENSVLMKQRSTKRWRLFGGTKPKLRSVDKDLKSDSNENLTGRKENGKKSKKDVETQPENRNVKEAPENQANEISASQAKKNVPESRAEKALPQTNEHPKNGLARSTSKDATTLPDRKERAGLTPVAETCTKSTQRQLNSQEPSPKPLRHSLRKPSELRATPNVGFTRSISSSAATPANTGELKRTNSDIKTTDRVFTSLRRAREEKMVAQRTNIGQEETASTREETGAEHETKRARLDTKTRRESAFDDIERLI